MVNGNLADRLPAGACPVRADLSVGDQRTVAHGSDLLSPRRAAVPTGEGLNVLFFGDFVGDVLGHLVHLLDGGIDESVQEGRDLDALHLEKPDDQSVLVGLGDLASFCGFLCALDQLADQREDALLAEPRNANLGSHEHGNGADDLHDAGKNGGCDFGDKKNSDKK